MTSDRPPPDASDTPDTGSGSSGPAPEDAGDDLLRAQHLDLDTLSAYLDRQLPPAEQAAIRAHLATCPACGRELAELRATVALLRELPQYAPRRGFQLGPEYARGAARGAAGLSGWLERLIPALPALRIATAAVAVLLIAVIAGDLVLNQGPEPAPMRQTGGYEAERGGAPESFAPAGQPAPAVAPAGQSAPANEGQMPRAAAVPTSGEAAEDAAGGQPAEGGTDPAAPASIEEEDSAEDAPPVVSPEPAAEPAPRTSPSWWRLVQLGLGLALLWLIVTLAGVTWLRRDRT